jgi:hypothetical protein
MTRERHVANNIAEQEAQELENGRLSDRAVRSNRYPPRLKADVEDGVMRVFFASGEETEAANARLMECLGTDNPDFLDALILQLSRLSGGPDGKLHVNTLNHLIAVVSGIKPRDQVEAMLAAQMVSVHTATMTFANRLKHSREIERQDSAEIAFKKLTRSFTSQMEALREYRAMVESRRSPSSMSM